MSTAFIKKKTEKSEAAGKAHESGKREKAGEARRAEKAKRLFVVISPAKKMNVDTDTLPAAGTPRFLEDAETLLGCLRPLSEAELKRLWNCSDALLELNAGRLCEMDLRRALTPALISYEGIQYQYLSPKTLEEGALLWLSEHLRIISGFYGILRPFDGVVPYRLEMQAKGCFCGYRDLYSFWGERLYRSLLEEADGGPLLILNLASKEYEKALRPYRRPQDLWIDCIFAEEADGRKRQKATLAKMARGEMARYLAERFGSSGGACEEAYALTGTDGKGSAEKTDAAYNSAALLMDLETLCGVLRGFDRLGFSYAADCSDAQTLCFLRQR